MARPPVDVVVPVVASAEQLAEVVRRLASLRVGLGDTVTLVDNRASGTEVAGAGAVRVLAAREVQSSYFARNRGAQAGEAAWILFLDGDVEFDPDLLDQLFAATPQERTAVLAGAIEDVVARDSAVARHLVAHAAMSQHNTLRGPRPYAQTAHCAVRRSAFEAVGGFEERIRSGGDGDLCFRLADGGWALETREAAVRHHARARLRSLLGQLARHGAGMQWLAARHPGALPPRRQFGGLVLWLARSAFAAAGRAARGQRDAAMGELIGPLWVLAFEVGRRLPNEVGRASWVDRWLR